MEPTQRQDPSNIFVTGIKAIDGLLSLGLGQRVGIFAASGVGKTTLVNQIIGQVNVDKCVVCLVGERGREVEAFWQSKSDMIKSGRITCVAATSDMSAIMRIRAVNQAMCLAEYWRSKGEHVLLIIDSVTRYAMALREVGLASGEPPTLRAYTPNVFESLPRLVERCGGMKTGGSITAIMTILSETDDVDDPIVEVMKSLLDGHIILSRQLAELGHFPAIDVSKSKSRLAHKLMDAEHDKNMRRAISMLSAFEEARIIIESGVYKSGTNPLIDTAINSQDDLSAFLTQECNDNIPLDNTLEWLAKITNGENAHV